MNPVDLNRLFAPHILARQARLTGKRLVHYTSAEAAYRIISGKQVWLRNAQAMNDYSELRHGLSCLQVAWASEAGQHFKAWLDNRWAGTGSELERAFDGELFNLLNGTFIMSLSEHDCEDDPTDNQLGRLSMWRAYGGTAGVALVLNSEAFLSANEALKVYSTPVFYWTDTEVRTWFEAWSRAIIKVEDALVDIGPEGILLLVSYVFRSIVLGTKHPGFKEEREWRVFYSPVHDGQSDWVSIETEIVGGIPQPIVKFRLVDDEARGVRGVALNRLLDSVIIGPCDNPLLIHSALTAAMNEAQVPDANTKATMSFIPLRQR